LKIRTYRQHRQAYHNIMQRYHVMIKRLILIQTKTRGYTKKRIFQRLRTSTIKIQSLFRMFRNRKEYRRMRWAAKQIQTFLKSQSLRFEYLKYRKIVCKLQATFKTKKQVKLYKQMLKLHAENKRKALMEQRMRLVELKKKKK